MIIEGLETNSWWLVAWRHQVLTFHSWGFVALTWKEFHVQRVHNQLFNIMSFKNYCFRVIATSSYITQWPMSYSRFVGCGHFSDSWTALYPTIRLYDMLQTPHDTSDKDFKERSWHYANICTISAPYSPVYRSVQWWYWKRNNRGAICFLMNITTHIYTKLSMYTLCH